MVSDVLRIDPRWLRTPQIDQPCSLSAQASREWLVSAGVSNFLDAEAGKTGSTDVKVSGERGRRLQLKKCELPIISPFRYDGFEHLNCSGLIR